MIDETTRRKPGFSAGNAVTLADGQSWTLPKPRFRFRPKFTDGKIEPEGRATYGPESEADLDVLYGAVEADGWEELRVEFTLAARLLRVNYELTDDEVSDLLVQEMGDPVSDERWLGISRALRGIAPKPSPAI